jgi:biopolymer transport protein ExbD
MAGGATYQDDEGNGAITDINVTPLVDIVLVLLIIFMVTATYIVNPAIKVELPKAASGDETVKTTLGLTLTREGVLHVNGEPRTEAEARTIIQAAVRANSQIQAIVSADRHVSHGDWVHLVDLAKLAGVRRFAIGTEPDHPR